MHPSGPSFTLDEIDYKQALEVAPELVVDNDVNHIGKYAPDLLM